MSADKQIILVTGATSGVGKSTAYALAAASASNHVIIGARSLEKGKKTLEELNARPLKGVLSLLELDLSKDETIEAAAAKLKTDFGRFGINLFGVMLLSEAVMPLLQASKAPKIINVSSALGSITTKLDATHPFQKFPDVVYRLAKAGINMLTACQHVKLEEFHGTAWAYCPGFVATNISGDPEAMKPQGAESPDTAAQCILEILEGKRDGDVGKFISKYGRTYPW